MSKPCIRVTIEYRDDKKKQFDCTDLPSVNSDFVTIYRDLRRTIIPAQAIKSVDYDYRP